MTFDPQPHLIKLPRKVKDKATGTWTTTYDDYLEVKWRLVMFRDRYPHGRIATEEVCVDLANGYARYKAIVEDGEGGTATGYGTETAADFGDYCERAETRALGRALAVLGFGTQFVGQDLAEMPHVADAPLAQTNGQAEFSGDTPNHSGRADAGDFSKNALGNSPNGDPPPLSVITRVADLPTRIPAGLQLPCAEALIVDLRPPQLSLLVGKVGLRALADKSLEPLHVALLAERARRMANGRKAPPAGEGAA
jgi:hypothetical protein